MDRSKLLSLVDIIEALMQQEGNEWFNEEIFDRLNKYLINVGEIHHPLVNKIYEYCIEEVTDRQANEFYKYVDFPLSIKEKLIEDYKKMEHCRRRDDYEGFSIAIYQQIEGVLNFFFSNNHFKRKLAQQKDTIVFNSNSQNNASSLIEYIYPIPPDLELDKQNDIIKKRKSLFGADGLPKERWNIKQKFRAVIILEVLPLDKFINQYFLFDTKFNFLHASRNLNHRGGKLYPSQIEIINRIKGNEEYYSLKFYGLLEEFFSPLKRNLEIDSSVAETSNEVVLNS